MTFIEWLREFHDYTGDGSTEDIQSMYGFYEISVLYEQYLDSGECNGKCD